MANPAATASTSANRRANAAAKRVEKMAREAAEKAAEKMEKKLDKWAKAAANPKFHGPWWITPPEKGDNNKAEKNKAEKNKAEKNKRNLKPNSLYVEAKQWPDSPYVERTFKDWKHPPEGYSERDKLSSAFFMSNDGSPDLITMHEKLLFERQRKKREAGKSAEKLAGHEMAGVPPADRRQFNLDLQAFQLRNGLRPLKNLPETLAQRGEHRGIPKEEVSGEDSERPESPMIPRPRKAFHDRDHVYEAGEDPEDIIWIPMGKEADSDDEDSGYISDHVLPSGMRGTLEYANDLAGPRNKSNQHDPPRWAV